jgi:hypothetical protein
MKKTTQEAELVELRRSKTGFEIVVGEVVTKIEITSTMRPVPTKSLRIAGCFHVIPMALRLRLLDWAWASLAPGGSLVVQAPYWGHGRSYADPAVVWPPLAWEFFALGNKATRDANVAGVDLECDFELAPPAFGYDTNDQYVHLRTDEVKATFLSRSINCATDVFLTLRKPEKPVNPPAVSSRKR